MTLTAFSQSININSFDRPIKVACIGDSITFGFGIIEKQTGTYPAQLAKMLGEKWEVHNFGINSATLLSKGDQPYIKDELYREAQEWLPDVVIIKLGTNDTKFWNWKYMDEFEADYSNFLAPFKARNPPPHIFICQIAPAGKNLMGIDGDIVKNQLNPMIRKIAEKEKVSCIDLYTPLLGNSYFSPDGVHPNTDGAGVIAKEIYKVLTGKNE